MKRVSSRRRGRSIKIVGVFLLVAALVAGVLGCPAEADDPAIQYRLTISSSPGGSVTTPGEGPFTYEEGAVVSLVAEAEEGYEFAGWTGDVNTIAAVNDVSATITMEGDYSITAKFVAQYVLTIDSTEGGEVTAPGEGTFAYDEGAAVSLVAVPEAGYRFLSWSGDADAIADSTSAATSITMDDNYSVRANFVPPYATSDTVLQGLAQPATHTSDGQGRIYFGEFDGLLNGCRISRFDPHTEAVIQLIEHQSARVQVLAIDGHGNLYYVLRHDVQPRLVQIRKLAPAETESQILFATEELDQWLTSFAVDWSGNVYFGLQSWDYEHSRGLPGAELCRIPAGTTTTETLLLLDDSLRILNITGVADDPNSIYFTSAVQGVDRIYRFSLESEVLATILERPTEAFGQIAYLAARADGELYYLYRQRSDPTDPVQFGYLEIGRFALDSLQTGQPPELLVADELDQAVWVWYANRPSFFAVSLTGDVFFSIILYQDGPFEQAQTGIFWFDPLSGSYAAVVEGTIEEVHGFVFVLDNEANLYYSAFIPDTIVRINR